MKASVDPTEKKTLDVQQHAIKRLANTMYGIYGFPRFRWYSYECAKAITSWGRQYIKRAMKKQKIMVFMQYMQILMVFMLNIKNSEE